MSGQSNPQKFWSHIDKSGECWIWTGAKTRGGYGHLNYQKRYYRAHRLAWILTFGPIPEPSWGESELEVCHKCNNPACVRPDHLFLGTHGDNIRDMWKKGRGKSPLSELSGPDHPRWKGGHKEYLEREYNRRRLAKKSI